MPQVTDAWFRRDALERVAVSPAGSAGDHQLGNPRPAIDDEWQRPVPAARLPERSQQAWIVLAWLDSTHRENKTRLKALGQRPSGHSGRDAFRNHCDLRLQARDLVKIQQVVTRGL